MTLCERCGEDATLGKWPVAPGAVLYEDRPDTPEGERRLHHVVARRIDPDTGDHFLVIEDGTHTTRMHYHAEDVLADFAPAGWQWPTGRKPTYHLTRNCGVYDKQDRMLEANR
jgi:hypothetical protein